VELSSFKKITTDVCQQTPNPDIHSAPPQSAVTPPGPSAPLPPNLTQPQKSETGTTLKSKSNNAPLVFHDLQAALRSRRAAMGCDTDEKETIKGSQEFEVNQSIFLLTNHAILPILIYDL
jgi:hypothetical protein